MKQITQISVQQKNKKRSNIYLDGKYSLSLSNIVILQNRLKVGMMVDEAFLVDLQQQNDFSECFDIAVAYISKYAKTKKQLIDYLMKKGYLYPVAFKVVEKLVSYGYVNDESFAKRFVESGSKNKGKLLLKRELLLKGIDEKCADNAINGILNESENAISVAEKYMRSKERDYKNLQKCYRYLLSKGFSFESAGDAISHLKSGCEHDC